MRFKGCLAATCALGLALLSATPAVRAQDPAPPVSSPEPADTGAFNGFWDYNALESINVATGRPEQSPSTARRVAPGTAARPPRAPAPGATGGPVGVGGPGALGGVQGQGGAGRNREVTTEQEMRFRAQLLAESRALTRDLLEVPESLSIRVTSEAVTFIDDLDRELTFPFGDDKLRRYQLSASKFEARAFWDGPRLQKTIEGPRGFRMTETYVLSQDRQRLFVVLRVGEERPGAPPIGSNRVYDRVNR